MKIPFRNLKAVGLTFDDLWRSSNIWNDLEFKNLQITHYSHLSPGKNICCNVVCIL